MGHSSSVNSIECCNTQQPLNLSSFKHARSPISNDLEHVDRSLLELSHPPKQHVDIKKISPPDNVHLPLNHLFNITDKKNTDASVFHPFFEKNEWRFSELYSNILQRFIDSKELSAKHNDALKKLQVQMQTVNQKQLHISDKFFSDSFIKSEQAANQTIAQLSLDIEKMKGRIDELNTQIKAQNIQEHIVPLHVQNKIAELKSLQKNLLEVSHQKISKEIKTQINQLSRQLDLVNKKFVLAQSKIFAHSSFKTAAAAKATLFEMHKQIYDAQIIVDNPNATSKEKKEAISLLIKSKEKAWEIEKLQQQSEQAGHIAIQKQLDKIRITTQRIKTDRLINQNTQLTKQLKQFDSIDIETFTLFSGIPPRNNPHFINLNKLKMARDEMIYHLVISKNKKEKIIETQRLAYAAGYLEASRVTKEIRNTLFDLAHQIRKDFPNHSQNLPFDLNKIDELDIHVQLDLMGVELNNIAYLYEGHAARAELEAHTSYEKNNALKVLVDNAPSGTSVSSEATFTIHGGTGIGQDNTAKVSATGSIGFTQSESYEIDHDTDILYIRTLGLNLGFGVKGKLGPLTGKLSSVLSIGLDSDYYENSSDEKGLEATRRFATIATNKRNLLFRGPLRKNKTLIKIYRIVRTWENSFNKKIGRRTLNPRFPFNATEKTFEQARRYSPSLFTHPQAHAHQLTQETSQYNYLLEKSFDNEDVVPLSIPAAISKTNSPKASKYPLLWAEFKTTAKASASTSDILKNVHSTEQQQVNKKALLSIVPGAHIEAGIEGKVKVLRLNAQRLGPTSINELSHNTGSLTASQNLATEIQTMWEKKSKNAPLPKDLEAARNLFIQGKNTQHSLPVSTLTYLNHAIWTITDLNSKLSELESLVSDLTGLAKYAPKNNTIKAIYRQKLEQFRTYQLPKDRLPTHKMYSRKGIKNAVGRRWGNIDSALFLIDQGVTALLHNQSSTDPAIQEALTLYDAIYSQTAKHLHDFNGPYTQDHLFRHAETQSRTYSIKKNQANIKMQVSAGLSLTTPASLAVPYLDKDKSSQTNSNSSSGEKIEKGILDLIKNLSLKLGVQGEINIERMQRPYHANDLREGTFTTLSGKINLSHLSHLLSTIFPLPKNMSTKILQTAGSKLISANIGPISEEMLPSTPQSESNLIAEATLELLGWGGNSISSNYSVIYRKNVPQAVIITSSTSNQLLSASPDILSMLAGGSLIASTSDTHTQTNAVLIMSRDLCFNILQASRLTSTGMTKTVVARIKEALARGDIQAIKALQQPFFDTIQQDPKKMVAYFGGDAIKGVLDGFIKMDRTQKVMRAKNGSPILENGYELFSDEISDEYAEMQKAMRWSTIYRQKAKEQEHFAQEAFINAQQHLLALTAQHAQGTVTSEQLALAQQDVQEKTSILEHAQALVRAGALSQLIKNKSDAPNKDYIFQQMGISQTQVQALLSQQLSASSTIAIPARFMAVPGLSIADFLDQATCQEKMDFCRDNPIGAQLFAAYLFIINQGDEIRSMYMSAKGYQHLISTSSQGTITENGKLTLKRRFFNKLTFVDYRNARAATKKLKNLA